LSNYRNSLSSAALVGRAVRHAPQDLVDAVRMVTEYRMAVGLSKNFNVAELTAASAVPTVRARPVRRGRKVLWVHPPSGTETHPTPFSLSLAPGPV
jgi:hypothetical protein